LIVNLISDFEENRKELKLAISKSDSLNSNMETFLVNMYQTTTPEISVDSIQHLVGSFFKPIIFFPMMESYEEAKSNGNLVLLKEKELSKYFIKFQERYNLFVAVQKQDENSFFNGHVWEMNNPVAS
tara:strand:- start:1171 stop:1551 length:381 start_codon:yes stop_codon:yes gene_type:complete